MNYFLALQHTYNGIELALFNKQTIIAQSCDDKKKASKNIVALVNQLLQDNDVSFNQLLFFAANQGPGPFTTLRVIIATANGFAFATKKPIIGIDGLDALLEEYKSNTDITLAILDAFSSDVYFAINNNNNNICTKGYKNIEKLLQEIKQTYKNKSIEVIGQATTLYSTEIQSILGAHNLKIFKNTDIPSIEQIGKMAWKNWDKQINFSNELMPLYLKDMNIL